MAWQDGDLALIESIRQNAYYTESGRFLDLTTQAGDTIDTIANVKLGAGGVTPDGLFSCNTNGELTALKTGPYMVKQNFQLSRTTPSGNTEAFFQAQISTDSGTTWVSIGNSANRRIDNSKSVSVFFDFSPLFVAAGSMFRNVWCKSSVGGDPSSPTVGANNGVLQTTRPSAALIALGIMDVPSAIAVIYKSNTYKYI